MIKICRQCKKSFDNKKKTGIFCSKMCFGLSRRTRFERVCPKCQKIFYVQLNRIKNTKRGIIHCSFVCSLKKIERICPKCGKLFTITPARIKNTKGNKIHCSWDCAWNNSIIKKCLICNKEIKVYPCLINRKKFCSPVCRTKGLPNYKNGSTAFAKQFRNTKEYKKLREDTFKKDNYTCVLCGYKGEIGYRNKLYRKSPYKGNRFPKGLVFDHIKSFAEYPDLRLNPQNVRTICKKCEKETDTYKRLWPGKKQYEV